MTERITFLILNGLKIGLALYNPTGAIFMGKYNMQRDCSQFEAMLNKDLTQQPIFFLLQNF